MNYHTSLLDSNGSKIGVVVIRTPATEIRGTSDHAISNQSLSGGQEQNPGISLDEMLRLAIENTDERFDEISSKEYWRFWY